MELVRPGTPPARVITPLQLHVLRFWNEPSAGELLQNFASRAVHIGGETMIGAIAAASVPDLAQDRTHVAPCLPCAGLVELYSLTITVTAKAKGAVPGAGLRLVDLRDTNATERQLVEMVFDATVIGALLSHPGANDADRPSWRVYLKPKAIRDLEDEGFVLLELGDPEQQGRIRTVVAALSTLETTSGMLLRLVTTFITYGGLLVGLRSIGLV